MVDFIKTTFGFLHLIGYDHERSDKEEKIMFAHEEKIVECIFKKYDS